MDNLGAPSPVEREAFSSHELVPRCIKEVGG